MKKFEESDKVGEFHSIIKIKNNKLMDCFNYYLSNSAIDNRVVYWNNLQSVLNAPDASDYSMKVVFWIKYLLLDQFGCAVPAFIDFEFETGINSKSNKNFQSLTIGLNDLTSSKSNSSNGLGENQTGW